MITKIDKVIYIIILLFILSFAILTSQIFYYIGYYSGYNPNVLTISALIFLATIVWGIINTVKYMNRNNWKLSGLKWFEIVFLMAPVVILVEIIFLFARFR